MTRIGHHRNRRLAEAARRKLERKTGQAWRIVSRRRRDGRHSRRGHTFVFESLEQQFIWLLTGKYHQEKGRRQERWQAGDIIVSGPRNATPKELLLLALGRFQKQATPEKDYTFIVKVLRSALAEGSLRAERGPGATKEIAELRTFWRKNISPVEETGEVLIGTMTRELQAFIEAQGIEAFEAE